VLAVRCGVEQQVVRHLFETAVDDGLHLLVVGLVLFEGQVVDEDDEAAGGVGCDELIQRLDSGRSCFITWIIRRAVPVNACRRDLTSEDLPVPRFSPEEHVVRLGAGNEAPGIVQHPVLVVVDPEEDRRIEPDGPLDRPEAPAFPVPPEGLMTRDVGLGRQVGNVLVEKPVELAKGAQDDRMLFEVHEGVPVRAAVHR